MKMPWPLNLVKQGKMMTGLNFRDYDHYWGLAPMMLSLVVGGVACSWYCVRLCYKPPDVELLSKVRPQPYESQPQEVKYRGWTNLNYDTIKKQKERLNVGELPSMTAKPRVWNQDEY